MYLFGKNYIFDGTEASCSEVIHNAKMSQSNKSTPIAEVVDILDLLSHEWREDGPFFMRALGVLESEGHFSKEMNTLSLKILPKLFSKGEVLKRLNGEFDHIKSLDRFVASAKFEGALKYEPLGIVLHVTAGNVFLGAIDSLLMALITKNISIVKLSQKNQSFPKLFLESLIKVDPEEKVLSKICFLSWRGGTANVESYFKKEVDGIIVWGGEDAITSYRTGLTTGTKLIEHGPKVSFQVVTKNYYDQMKEEDFLKLARDICLWDQSACANAQCLYIEVGIEEELLLANLSRAFNSFDISRRELSLDENLEKYGAIEIANLNKFKEVGNYISGEDFLLEITPHNLLSSSTLNRHLLIKRYKSQKDLLSALTPFKKYLQTCGLGCLQSEVTTFVNTLSDSGVKRITNIGSMLEGVSGAPHDGSYDLLGLVLPVVIEGHFPVCTLETPQNFALKMCQEIPYYRNLDITVFEDIPLADSELYRDRGPGVGDDLLNPNREKGILFSSGGTSGAPKYCFFGNSEFDSIAEALGDTYKRLGLEEEDVVGNLFTAGNMWSSFSVIQKALEKTTAMQLPMGAMIPRAEFYTLISTFKVNVLFGLPSLLCDLAVKSSGIKIKTIFYAGEPMRDSYKELLKEHWSCDTFISAGYAGVDVGPIGYQDLTCQGSEHILFEKLVYLEVIEGEAVVTSKVRSGMPVLRYKTGDRIEILEQSENRVKFKLLGRTDSLINIWASRISLQDIFSQFTNAFKSCELQVILSAGKQTDIMTFNTENQLSGEEAELLLLKIYKASSDLAQTHSLSEFKKRCDFKTIEFLRSEKTGKVKDLVDQR